MANSLKLRGEFKITYALNNILVCSVTEQDNCVEDRLSGSAVKAFSSLIDIKKEFILNVATNSSPLSRRIALECTSDEDSCISNHIRAAAQGVFIDVERLLNSGRHIKSFVDYSPAGYTPETLASLKSE